MSVGIISQVPKEKAAAEIQGIYDDLTKSFGLMPNIFSTMAHRPNVLKYFLPLFHSVMQEGAVEARYKTLAYLKTSLINGCEY